MNVLRAASLLVPPAIAIMSAAVLAGPTEITLQNDGFFDGQAVNFQGGFVIGEMAASRFLPPAGTWRINRVELLFGSTNVTETVTLRVYDDAAQTPAPGPQQFFGDYQLTGSATVLHQIDLSASNVLVSGPFRVALEFQHDGPPSVASDTDGSIQPDRNFIFAFGSWFESSTLGVTGDWVLRAVVEEVGGGGGEAPVILTIEDVGNDQGRQVRVRFARSSEDQSGATTPVQHYEMLRRVDPLPAPMFAVQIDGWDYVGQIPAHGDDVYSVIVPTLADSTVTQGLHMTTFMVRAATGTPTVFFDSASDSGYSVDNLPPLPPQAFAAAYENGATQLEWAANLEDDLWYYTLHRGESAAFVPDPGNRIAATSAPAHADAGPAGRYYKLAAVDVNGNMSAFVLITPEATVGVGAGGVTALAIAPAGAHPVRDGRLRLSVALPSGSPARIELLDPAGRRVASRSLAAPGRHMIEFTDAAPAPGVYLARIVQGDDARTTRIIVAR